MVSKKLKWYELGEKIDEIDSISKKEIAISQFKSGFSTKIFPILFFNMKNFDSTR